MSGGAFFGRCPFARVSSPVASRRSSRVSRSDSGGKSSHRAPARSHPYALPALDRAQDLAEPGLQVTHADLLHVVILHADVVTLSGLTSARSRVATRSAPDIVRRRHGPGPFAPAAEAGIHRLAIPTPFAVGRVNCYLIDDDPLTLVDAGPNSGASAPSAANGARLSRKDDRRSRARDRHPPAHRPHRPGRDRRVALGAEVAAIDAAVPFISEYSERAAADDEFSGQIMLRHGISPTSSRRSSPCRAPSARGERR